MAKKKVKHRADIWCESILKQFPNALDAAESFYEDKSNFGNSWPDWCDLPMGHE